MGTADWTRLLALGVLWGGSFFFVEIALTDLPPLTVVLVRVVLAALALHALLLVTGARVGGGLRLWGRYAAMGVLNNVVPFTLIVWAQTTVTGGLASILNATTPLFTVVLAHALTRDERLTATRALAVGTGLAGVVVIVGPEALRELGADAAAQCAVLAAAASYALAAIYGRRFRGLDPRATAAGQLTASSVILLPIVVVLDRPWTLAAPGAGATLALVGLAVASTALAYVLYFRILSSAGSTNLMLVTFLIPVTAIALGAAFLAEPLAARQIAGAALIGVALVLVNPPWRRARG